MQYGHFGMDTFLLPSVECIAASLISTHYMLVAHLHHLTVTTDIAKYALEAETLQAENHCSMVSRLLSLSLYVRQGLEDHKNRKAGGS